MEQQMSEPAVHLCVHLDGPLHLPQQQQLASLTSLVSISNSNGCMHLQRSAVATLHRWHTLLAPTCTQSKRDHVLMWACPA